MPVTTKHPDYEKHLPAWTLVRDACSGPRAIKAKKTTYLPATTLADPASNDEGQRARYQMIIERANYVNIVGRTRNGLVGAVFRDPAEVNLPSQISYLEEGADTLGNSLEQVAKSIVHNLQEIGRHGILVDAPQGAEGMSLEQARSMGVRANLCEYTAENVINWKEQDGKLVLVVLKEQRAIEDDDYSHESETVYRVLKLEEGRYVQRLMNEDEEIIEESHPRQAGGGAWTEIPFILPGSVNNDPCVDPVTLYDLADLNLAHYRNSADFELNLHIHGSGTLFITSKMAVDEFKAANPNGIILGAQVGHFLGEDGKAELLQLAPAQAIAEAMKHKEDQMLALGAKMVERSSGNQTAEEIRTKSSAETSTLDTIVGNAEAAILKCLEWAAMFEGGNVNEIEYTLNREYFDRYVDPQTVIAGIQLYDRGLVARADMVDVAKRAQIVKPDRTGDDIQDEVEIEGPLIEQQSTPA